MGATKKRGDASEAYAKAEKEQDLPKVASGCGHSGVKIWVCQTESLFRSTDMAKSKFGRWMMIGSWESLQPTKASAISSLMIIDFINTERGGMSPSMVS